MIIGFELKLNKLRSEVSTTNAKLNNLRTALFVQPLVELSLQELLSKELDQVIVELANILSEGSPNISGGSSSKDNNKDSLIEDLKKYGSIKSTLQGLDQQAYRLMSNRHITKTEATFGGTKTKECYMP
ncbi:MAG TPA: hypothetical protein VH500_23460 [Nitrososphaeraceae archaeon]|jgi:hypothetical protein